ncbi:Serine threonine- kinase N2 [Pelobates cultripes]|uniref:Serine threonine- kinase N2, partial n=1 Tax=Pelobates cultripes TaxID=61616 RepID=A0AAD1R8U2_PELCU|nr:Serine threonine- kinase N2 [Pelobates cultripes]
MYMASSYEISDAPTSDTSSQADNVKLSALQKQLDIELKVKQGAENLIKAYSNDPPKNAKHIAAVLEKRQDSENKIARLRSRIQSLIKEQPSLPAPETDINTAAPSMLVTDTQEPELAGFFQLFSMKPIVLPDVELHLDAAPAPSQTFLYSILPEISIYIEFPDFLAQDFGEGHEYTSDSKEMITNPTPDVRIRLRIPLTMEDFKLRSVLGRGSFGKISLSLLIEKRVFQVVTNRRHPFLINMFGSFHTQDHAVFVMEYAAGGDLKTHLKRGPFPEPRAVDLKLENIVLDEKGFVKITDFGLCKEGIGYGDSTGTPWGTPLYAAPEVLKGKPYTRAVDWWSVGVVIYAMLSGKFPFESLDEDMLTASIIKGKFLYPESLSRNATSIIRQGHLMPRSHKASPTYVHCYHHTFLFLSAVPLSITHIVQGSWLERARHAELATGLLPVSSSVLLNYLMHFLIAMPLPRATCPTHCLLAHVTCPVHSIRVHVRYDINPSHASFTCGSISLSPYQQPSLLPAFLTRFH